MQDPARYHDRFSIPPHSSGFPAPALNTQLSTFNSPLTTLHSLFSVLCFQHLTSPSARKALTDRFLTPSVSAASELLFQQFPFFHKHLPCPLVFPAIDFRALLHRNRSQCFQQFTNPS